MSTNGIRRLLGRLLPKLKAEAAPSQQERQGWPHGVPPAQCEIFDAGQWRRVLVDEAIEVRSRDATAAVRCFACHGDVRLYRASKSGDRAYFQHVDKGVVCQLKRLRRESRRMIV